jgi:hypothetical protein
MNPCNLHSITFASQVVDPTSLLTKDGAIADSQGQRGREEGEMEGESIHISSTGTTAADRDKPRMARSCQSKE